MKTFVLVIAAIGVLAFTQTAGALNVWIDIAPQFCVGDSVCFRWVNGESASICGVEWPNPWRIFGSDSVGVGGYPCATYPMFWTLPAGESRRYCWNQKDCYGHQVPAGTYEVCIPYRGPGCQGSYDVCQTFVISNEPSPSNEHSWGRLKALYR